MGEQLRAFWERIRADIHRNPGLWIGVGISAAVLIVAYLAYRRNAASNSAQVPANGYGFPDYGTASGGSTSGSLFGGYSPYQPASPASPVGPSFANVPPATPAVAFPSFPSYPAFSLTPAAPAASSGPTGPTGPVAQLVQAAYPVQNPLKAAQLAHRGVTPNWTVYGVVNNPLKAAQLDHRGTTSTVSYTAPTSYTVPHYTTSSSPVAVRGVLS